MVKQKLFRECGHSKINKDSNTGDGAVEKGFPGGDSQNGHTGSLLAS